MRKLAWFAGSFSLGIFLAQYVIPDGCQLPGASACFLLACAALFLPGVWKRRGLLAMTALSLALGWNWLYVRQVQRPMEELAGTESRVTMTLCEYAVPTDYGVKVTVELPNLPGKAVYYGSTDLLEAVPGQTVTDTVAFQSAARIRDDDVTTFTSKGIFLLAYQRGEAVLEQGSADSLRWWPVRLGREMRLTVNELFEGDTAAFLTAILTGDKSALSEEASAALSEAGLYHILAVSGMHCGFLLAIMTLVLGRHRRRLVALCAIPVLIFYVCLTGGSPSVVRACVMLAMLLAAPLFRRDSDGITALSFALFLILLENPFAAASVSLQLSFGAMAGILFLTGRLYRLLLGEKKRGETVRFLVSGFSATMGALVFTVPLSALYFGTLVLISPLSNLLCLWAAGLVFMTGFAVTALGFVCLPLAGLLAVIPRLLAGYILFAAERLADIPYHAVYFANPYLKFWLAFVYILFAAAWLGKAKRAYAPAAGVSVLALVLTVALGAARYDGALETLVLDAGQGQSIILQAGDAFALVDCGSGSSWYGPGETAAHQLMTMGCGKLDYLVLTHYDADHINGLPALLARLDVETLLVPEGESELLSAAEKSGAAVRTVTEETELPFGDGSLALYPPLGDAEDNERGLAVLASSGEWNVLVTGDMSTATEKKLLKAYDLPDIDALVAGHHGAKTSTSRELLEELEPESVCISVGSNSYGHPAAETLWRLKEAGCTVYRTDLQGTIRLSYR